VYNKPKECRPAQAGAGSQDLKFLKSLRIKIEDDAA